MGRLESGLASLKILKASLKMNASQSFGPFVLDPARRQLSRGAQVVHLTPRAFDLLWLLASTDGPVRKETLMATVWPGLVVEENNLTVTIAAIRRALGDAAKAPTYIRTRPGIGYEFVAPRTRVESAAAVAGLVPKPRCWRAVGWLSAAAVALIAISAVVTLALQRSPIDAGVPATAHRELVSGYNAMYRRTADGNREALDAFGRATRIAPGPMTWSALAEAYYSEAVFQFSARTPRAAFEDARRYVRMTLDADPENAHALWIDAALRFYLEQDWRGSKAAFRHALDMNPNSAAARRTFAWLLLTIGDTQGEIGRASCRERVYACV